jgi:hypothetical protein
METKITMTTVITVSDQDVDDIMVTALEGGINYWCGKARVKARPVGNPADMYASDIISKGGILELSDAEEPDTKWELTKDKFFKGLSKYLSMEPGKVEENGTIDPANLDANDADLIIQYALFDEQVYG